MEQFKKFSLGDSVETDLTMVVHEGDTSYLLVKRPLQENEKNVVKSFIIYSPNSNNLNSKYNFYMVIEKTGKIKREHWRNGLTLTTIKMVLVEKKQKFYF